MSNKVKDLTAQQVETIGLLLAGSTQREAAEAVGVAEETVSRWRNNDAAFIAAYNGSMRSLLEATAAELAAARREAVGVLRDALVDDNPRKAERRIRVSLALLKLPPPPEVGPTNAEDIAQDLADAELTRSLASRGLSRVKY